MTSTPTTAAAEQPEQSRPSAVGGPGLLAVDGTNLELPRTPATDGADGLGVSKLLGSTGVVTLDPGFTNTASCTSQITYIDGAAGILRYRGYPIVTSMTVTTIPRRAAAALHLRHDGYSAALWDSRDGRDVPTPDQIIAAAEEALQ